MAEKVEVTDKLVRRAVDMLDPVKAQILLCMHETLGRHEAGETVDIHATLYEEVTKRSFSSVFESLMRMESGDMPLIKMEKGEINDGMGRLVTYTVGYTELGKKAADMLRGMVKQDGIENTGV